MGRCLKEYKTLSYVPASEYGLVSLSAAIGESWLAPGGVWGMRDRGIAAPIDPYGG